MAVKDTARVRTRLVGLFPKASGFKKERLDALAAKLKATDDSTDEEIDTELTAINDSGFQTFEQIKIEDDRIATELAKAKKPVETPKPESKTDDDEPLSSDPVIAAMQKQMKELNAKLAEKEAKENLASLSSRFSSDERLKGIPASWVRNNTPKTEEEFETAVEGLVKEYGEFATEHKLTAFGKDAPPVGQRTPKGEAAQISKDEAKEIVGNLLGNIK